MSNPINRRWYVARAATDAGLALTTDVFGQDRIAVPEPGVGELLIRASWFSPDPMNHAWVRGLGDRFQRIEVGDAMKGGIAGRVVKSNHPGWKVGDGVTGFLDWQDYCVSDGTDRLGVPLQRVPAGLPLESGLATLGMTGVCAWFGLMEIGRPKPGDVVLVSGASGAIGSIAGQIAKLAGARAIGIARGAEKCRLVKSLGFDDVVDFNDGDLTAHLGALAPRGIDVFFDNVGGPMLDAALASLAHGARVVICGAIAHYGGGHGISNHLMLALRGATMSGFFYFDHIDRWPEARERLAGWLRSGAIREAIDVAEGFDAVPEAAVGQFKGGAAGRRLVRIAADPNA
jgi:NADPH-dependent curcumin reductase CurA